MGNYYFLHKLVINYGYWLDLLTISLEIREWAAIILFPKLRFIVDIIVFSLLLGTTYGVIKKLLKLECTYFAIFFLIPTVQMSSFAHNSENCIYCIGKNRDTSLQIRTDEDPLGRKIYFLFNTLNIAQTLSKKNGNQNNQCIGKLIIYMSPW